MIRIEFVDGFAGVTEMINAFGDRSENTCQDLRINATCTFAEAAHFAIESDRHRTTKHAAKALLHADKGTQQINHALLVLAMKSKAKSLHH